VLYIVLVLVLAALGLLVTALITATSLWAWISIGLSVLAGVILVVDWLRRRSKRSAEVAAAETSDEDVDEVAGELPEDEVAPPETSEQTELITAAGELDSSTTAVIAPASVDAEEDGESGEDPESEEDAASEESPPVRATESGDPGEERTDEADLLVVSELDDEVVVVDEYPRYHLTKCVWLAGRDLIPIGVSEARQLGFTPCVRCGPDAVLATKHRESTPAEG
jgi:hypothetical protein